MEARQEGDTYNRIPEPKESHLGNCDGGPDVMDKVLLEISSKIQTPEAYSASELETERLSCMIGTTLQLSAEGGK